MAQGRAGPVQLVAAVGRIDRIAAEVGVDVAAAQVGQYRVAQAQAADHGAAGVVVVLDDRLPESASGAAWVRVAVRAFHAVPAEVHAGRRARGHVVDFLPE